MLCCAQGYGNQEEDDLDGWGAGGATETTSKEKLAAKHKSRTISINPTEGFQYSDVYFVSLSATVLQGVKDNSCS